MSLIKPIIILFLLLSSLSINANELKPIEVKLDLLKPGMSILLEYNNLPVYVIYRTDKEIAHLQSKRKTNQLRSKRSNYFVTWGYNPSSGCPLVYASSSDKEWWKGYQVYDKGGLVDKCINVEFDLSGRTFKHYKNNVLELPIPPYKFLSDKLILIGEE